MRFSVIIPIFKAERFLNTTLESVRSQTFTDFECICIDDGSPDSSGTIADNYAKLDSRFVVIHQENAGEGNARNSGLSIAKGEWISFLDADDVWRPTLLADVHAAILENNPDLVHFASINFDENNEPIFTERVKDDGVEKIAIDTSLPDLLVEMAVWNVVYRRDKFGGLRFKAYKNGADLVYLTRAFTLANSIAIIRKTEHGWRQCDWSMCHRPKTTEIVLDLIRYQVEMFSALAGSKKNIGDALGRCRGNGLLESLLHYMHGGSEWTPVWEEWLRALGTVRSFKFFSPWQRFVMSVITCSKSRLLASLLCALPYRLKLMGFHR